MHVHDPLSWPQFRLKLIAVPPGVSGTVRQIMDTNGIPERGVGAEFISLDVSTFLEAHPNLLSFGTSGVTGRICLDVASLEIVHVPFPESLTINPVNSNLTAFNASIEATISRFPFYTYETAEDDGEVVAAALRIRLKELDSVAGAHNGLWETFLDDVAMGNYAEEEYEQAR